MRAAVGMMACIAIAFFCITSPDQSKSHASSETQIKADILQQGLQDYLDQRLASDSEKVLADIKQMREKLESSICVDLTELAAMREELRTLRSEMDQRLKEVSSPPTAKTASITPKSSTTDQVSKNAATSVSKYISRWSNHDGLSAREHAERMHGINTAGLTDDQIAMMRDRDHDEFGPDHPDAMRQRNQALTGGSVSGTQFVSQKTRSRSTTTSDNSVPMQQTNYSTSSYQTSRYRTCPQGGCPDSVQTRGGGLLGFGIIGRNR